jgi:Cu(I)/Ag(I) efflux system membrane fusion protein
VILGKPTDRVVLALDGDQHFRSVAVRRGIEAGNLVEITEGLAAGQRVVVSAQFLIDSESNRRADISRMEPSP